MPTSAADFKKSIAADLFPWGGVGGGGELMSVFEILKIITTLLLRYNIVVGQWIAYSRMHI